MKLTVDDLIDLVVDLTARTYGGEGGVVDHAFESTGEWATEVLCELGVAVPVDARSTRFRILPRAERPPLGATVQVEFYRTPHGGAMEARGPISTAEIAKQDEAEA